MFFWDDIGLSYSLFLSPTGLPNDGGIYFEALRLELFNLFDRADDLVDFRLQEKTEYLFSLLLDD